TGGTAQIIGTNVQFTPAANFSRAAGFTYTLQDNGTTNGVADFKTGTGNVSFTIDGVNPTDVNDSPTGVNEVLPSVVEDSGVRTISIASLLANDSPGLSDESGQSLIITAVSNVVGGTAVIVGTNVQFTPATDFVGAASFKYTLQDNGTSNG